MGAEPERPASFGTSDASIFIAPARYVLLPLAEALTGYTVKAMERKIERGDWQEGKVWRRAPDGRVMIDLQGYQRWVESR
ncbi:excisionase [Steroidobacter flavus]|uniref:Excisionase n=1 Tax=Steroidobacter flavus TaxID=1842136 RepID=A0ABV8SR85_9GAMM